MMREAREGGFTLLELLVVVAILGLTVVALANGVRFAGRAWELQELQSKKRGDLDAVQNVLRQMITSATDFDGDSVSLRFVGTLPDALGRGGLYDLELRALADRLVLGWRPHFRGPTADAGWNTAQLTAGVRSLELAYHAAPSGWQSIAHNGSRPGLVRIDLQLSDGRIWPPLTIAPMVEARSGVMK